MRHTVVVAALLLLPAARAAAQDEPQHLPPQPVPKPVVAKPVVAKPVVAAPAKAEAHHEATEAPEPAERMETDRPSFTEGTGTIAAHRVQAEAGYTLHGDGALHEHTVGELLVRAGLGARAELRLSTTYDAVHEHGETMRGMRDGAVGTKVNLVPRSHGLVPALSLVGGTSLPSGGDRFTEGHATPEAKIALGWSLGEGAALSANANWARPMDEAGRYDASAWSVLASQSLGRRTGAFAELWATREERAGEAERFADGGLTFALTDALQLDMHAGARVSHGEGRAFFAGVGIARRW